MVTKVWRAVEDIVRVLGHKKASFYTRLEIAKALLRLKCISPKIKESKISLFGHSMLVTDPGDVQYMIKEIWLEQPYRLPANVQVKSVVDVGANLGFSVLYFYLQFPNAKYTAIEADPANFELLRQNVHGFLPKAELLSKAAWNKEGHLNLHSGSEQATSNKSIQFEAGNDGVAVPCIDFAMWLQNNPVDLVKLDIEGAEAEVMDAVIASGTLTKAKHWFIEFHTERFGTAVFERVSQAFSDVGYQCESRGIIGYFHV